jgi:hypothetical protein
LSYEKRFGKDFIQGILVRFADWPFGFFATYQIEFKQAGAPAK